MAKKKREISGETSKNAYISLKSFLQPPDTISWNDEIKRMVSEEQKTLTPKA